VDRPQVPQRARELLRLIDEFEQFVSELPRVPLTGKLLVDEEDLYGFAEQLRRTIPEEVHRALEILQQRERLLAEARAQAEAILEEARREAERLVAESAVLRRAEEEAERILREARQIGLRVRGEADAYADEVLAKVEAFLERALAHIREGRAQLHTLAPAAAGEDNPSPTP